MPETMRVLHTSRTLRLCGFRHNPTVSGICVERAQARREAALYAPEPGEAGIGGAARTVEVEQFPGVSLSRDKTGAGEVSGMGTGNQASSGREFCGSREPTHTQSARMSGAPA
jgi:hypothetical protein